MKSNYNSKNTKITYRATFRLVFVIFFLYLLGDALYRWEGVKYYAYLSEFISSVALIVILWSVASAITALIIWLFIMAIGSLLTLVRIMIRAELILLFLCFVILLTEILYIGKISFAIDLLSRSIEKQIFTCIIIMAAFSAWLLRNKIVLIQERITPLVWLFGIIVMISVPVVSYSVFYGGTNADISQEVIHSSEADKNRPNIIFVIFDAMTARDMSLYGYQRDTTPFIDEWARGATVLSRLEAASNWTPPTVASIMSGKRPWTHRVYQPFSDKIVKGGTESLPLMLRKNGYYTMAYVTNDYATVKKLGIASGFNIDYPINTFKSMKTVFELIDSKLGEMFIGKIKLHNWFTQKDFIFAQIYKFIFGVIQTGDPTRMNRVPEIAFNKFLEDIDHTHGEPFFAWIHLYPPHDPYLPPEPFMGMFNASSDLRTSTSQDNIKEIHVRYRNKKMQGRLDEIQPSLDTLRARYDEDIVFCDKQFEKFIQQLKERSLLKNTVIILSADHGESFQHIKVGHGEAYLYEQLTHIPFILKEPEQAEGRIVNNILEQTDVPATILDLAGIPVPLWMEGRSFKPLLRGESLPQRTVFSMNFENNPSRGEQINDGVIAVWEDDYKMIHYLGNRKSHIFNQSSLLFNLKEDPDELINLFDKEPERGQHMLSLIQGSLKQANERLRIGE